MPIVSGEKAAQDGHFLALRHRGRPRKDEEKRADGTLKRGSNSRSYIVGRLMRDGHAELAAKVLTRQMSARRAAIIAGWGARPPRSSRSKFDAVAGMIG